MRHHPQDVPLGIHDASDVLRRSVGVGLRGDSPGGVAVAKDDLPSLVQGLECRGVGVVVSFAVGDGDAEHLARRAGSGEGGGGVLHPEVDPPYHQMARR